MRNGWRRPIGAADLAAACLRSFSERAWRRGTTKNSSFARHKGFCAIGGQSHAARRTLLVPLRCDCLEQKAAPSARSCLRSAYWLRGGR